ncbi:DNA damage-binding protein cmr1 [Typha angustifolia]|uniref:DNA damage-binding protein cmr1 n=1 Tax=Typha angustifolia TaxID=59011 RepID=UPI003C2DB184
MASSESLTPYERRRLENIRRNEEMMSSLMLRRKASDLSSSLKRPSSPSSSSSPDSKKPKNPKRAQTPVVVVTRRSLRTRGLPPDQSQHSEHPQPPSPPPNSPPAPPRKSGPFPISDAFVGEAGSSCRRLIDVILGSSGEPRPDFGEVGFDPRSEMVLRPENVAKVLPQRILTVKFLPSVDRTVIVSGDKLGNLGFWDVDGRREGGDGHDEVFVFSPHRGPVSGIAIHPASSTKIISSCYDGFVCLMDTEKETFNMIYCSDNSIFSICQCPHDNNTLYLGEGLGELKSLDMRAGKVTSTWDLHEQRINTVDFNPENTNLLATSSTDGMACIWDLRSIKRNRVECLKTVQHFRAIHSAYFSPSGSCLATTSYDNRVGILTGTNFDDQRMIKHNNKTGKWLSSFRAIWGWDDSYLYLGNMKRAVDIISINKLAITSLESEHMTSIPCRFAAHPYKQGSLASATAGGKVYLWRKL